jgi:hypothetical protein
MPINPDAVGSTGDEVEITWNADDCLLYAVSVGAGVTDPTGFELEFTTENSAGVVQRALPTMPVVLGLRNPVSTSANSPLAKLGSFDLAMLVHG